MRKTIHIWSKAKHYRVRDKFQSTVATRILVSSKINKKE